MSFKLIHQNLISNQKMMFRLIEIPSKKVFSLQDTKGFVDLADEEVILRDNQHSTLQASLCQALGRVLGVSQELHDFDCVQCLCKRKGNCAFPVELKKQ